MSFIHVDSEVEPLKKVLLHRPGMELEELTPPFMEELLFDDIPWLKGMAQEHDSFAQTLKNQGVQVFYYQELLEQLLEKTDPREKLIHDLFHLHSIHEIREQDELKNLLNGMNSSKLAQSIIGGLHQKTMAESLNIKTLSAQIQGEFNYIFPPLANLYFTRDPGAVIGRGLSVNTMATRARRGEPLILKHIIEYLGETRGEKIDQWFGHNRSQSLEGGDILVLSPKVVLIGCSARSSSSAIEVLSRQLLEKLDQLEQVLVFQIPFQRAYMHLDTVFTMVDHNTFTIFTGIQEQIKIFSLSKGKGDQLKIKNLKDIPEALESSLGISSVRLINSGGSDHTSAAREQWNDSTNTLAIAPGRVITYNRNQITNESLDKAGIEVIPIEGSELVRGRGGPRCMSMPLERSPWSL